MVARGNGERTCGRILAWEGKGRWEASLCEGGAARCPSQCLAQGMPAVIPVPLIPWFAKSYSSFKHLVACLESLFLKEAVPDPLEHRFATHPPPSEAPSRMLYFQDITAHFTQHFRVFTVSSSQDCKLTMARGSYIRLISPRLSMVSDT